ncbi:MAG: hypothetical protein K6D90_09170, partial [Lachnospiraceae bacterium]|nr:hypothetical protein [Lachnospiraceae bacterium]
NTYNCGHAVNLVGYERSTKSLWDGSECESVIFDVYDSNCPGRLLKLECYKIYAWDGHYAMMYQYNPCSAEYNASFLLDDYTIGEEEGSKCIKFALFNDQGQCLNVKLY